jgi:hypothetical protein
MPGLLSCLDGYPGMAGVGAPGAVGADVAHDRRNAAPDRRPGGHSPVAHGDVQGAPLGPVCGQDLEHVATQQETLPAIPVYQLGIRRIIR